MRVIVLGGYGHFGGRIARQLAADGLFEVLIAGRDVARAGEFIQQSGHGRKRMSPARLDIDGDGFARELQALAPALVIHAAGPFQGRDYSVARAALACGAHYIDLADARGFVSGIGAIDEDAKQAGRLAISGASSVPGISAAVVEAHAVLFSKMKTVEAGISPGNRSPRGLATTRAVLGYVGKPYLVLVDGGWRVVHGWQSLRRVEYPGAGARWLARCEVPDLDVLPRRYPDLRSCDFRAGLELHRMHFGLWLASWCVRAGLIASVRPWSERLLAISERWLRSGSDIGTMHIDMQGIGLDGRPLRLRWLLIARQGDGPQVPCTPAIVLARKLARGELAGSGAKPCLDLFTLHEVLQAFEGYAIETSRYALL